MKTISRLIANYDRFFSFAAPSPPSSDSICPLTAAMPPKKTGAANELEIWIKEQFPKFGINPHNNLYIPRPRLVKKLIKEYPVKSDEMTKKIKNATIRM